MSVTSNLATDTVESKGLDEIDFSRDAKFLKISPQCVRECGIEAAITLAVFRRHSTNSNKNFERLSSIAASAGANVRTVKRHFAKLEAKGWVVNEGRDGRRRTSTRFVPGDIAERMDGADWKMVLPVWSLMLDLRGADLALLAIAFHRVKGLMNPLDGRHDCVNVEDDEFEWAIREISDLTGIDRKTIRVSRQRLVDAGLVRDEYQPEGKVKLSPQTYDEQMCEDHVFASPVYFEGKRIKHVGLLGKSVPRGLGNVSLGVGKCVPRNDLKDNLSKRPIDTKSGSPRTVCEISTSSLEAEEKSTQGKSRSGVSAEDLTTLDSSRYKSPLWNKLITLSGRTLYHSNKEIWKYEVGQLLARGHDPQEIERVFVFATNKDRWFSSVDPRRDFPIRHFAKCYGSLSKRALEQRQAA